MSYIKKFKCQCFRNFFHVILLIAHIFKILYLFAKKINMFFLFYAFFQYNFLWSLIKAEELLRLLRNGYYIRSHIPP